MTSIGMIRRIAGVFVIGALAAGCASAGGAEAGGAMAAPAVTPEMIAQGQALYSGTGNCQTCHGAGGAGGRFGPSLADGDWLWFDASSPNLLTEMAALIRAGVPEPRGGGLSMPAMGGGNLSEDQVLALAAYLVSLNQ